MADYEVGRTEPLEIQALVKVILPENLQACWQVVLSPVSQTSGIHTCKIIRSGATNLWWFVVNSKAIQVTTHCYFGSFTQTVVFYTHLGTSNTMGLSCGRSLCYQGCYGLSICEHSLWLVSPNHSSPVWRWYLHDGLWDMSRSLKVKAQTLFFFFILCCVRM